MCGASNEQKIYFQTKYLIKNEISTSLVCKLLKECSININLFLQTTHFSAHNIKM